MGSAVDEVEQGAECPTVLLVEDDPLVRLLGADHLRQSGYRVVEAGR